MPWLFSFHFSVPDEEELQQAQGSPATRPRVLSCQSHSLLAASLWGSSERLPCTRPPQPSHHTSFQACLRQNLIFPFPTKAQNWSVVLQARHPSLNVESDRIVCDNTEERIPCRHLHRVATEGLPGTSKYCVFRGRGMMKIVLRF